MRGLAADPSERFATARDMAFALERCARAIRPSEIGAWVEDIAAEKLALRSRLLAAVEDAVPEDVASSTAVVPRSAELGSARSDGFGASHTRATPSPVLAAPRAHAEPGVPTDTNAVTETARPGAERSRKLAAIVLPLALLAIAAGAYLFLSARAPTEPHESAAASSAPAPTAYAEPIASAPPVASVEPSPSSVASAAKAGSKPTPAVVRPRAPSAPRAKCDPPYTMDAAGRRIFKVECM
jgi:serine/threonine-protein kinase